MIKRYLCSIRFQLENSTGNKSSILSPSMLNKAENIYEPMHQVFLKYNSNKIQKMQYWKDCGSKKTKEDGFILLISRVFTTHQALQPTSIVFLTVQVLGSKVELI